MPAKTKRYHKVVFIITIVLGAFFLWLHTFGQNTNIEFKSGVLRRLANGLLIISLIAFIILSIIFLWRLIEDDFNTKAIFTLPLLAFSFWVFTTVFNNMFKGEWETTKISKIENDPAYTHLLEQVRHDNFLFHTVEKRTVRVKSFLGIFWKVKIDKKVPG